MTNLEIVWLSDSSDCDQGGCSGGWSEGARVMRDGELWFELIPRAHCFGGDSWDKEQVFAEIMARLGYTVSFDYGGDL